MKRLMIMSLSIFIFMIGNNHVNAQSVNDKYSNTTLEVQLDCNACAEKVQTQLAYTKGVKEVKADYIKDEVQIKYLTKKTSEKNLIESLAKIDYKASVKNAKASTVKSPCSSQQKSACGGTKAPCSSKKSE